MVKVMNNDSPLIIDITSAALSKSNAEKWMREAAHEASLYGAVLGIQVHNSAQKNELDEAFATQYPLSFHAPVMGEYMLNSVLVTALSLGILLVFALPSAYCLSRFEFKGRNVLKRLLFAGLFINVSYISVPIFLMLKDGDAWLNKNLGFTFFLDNLFILSVVYASTALPFTVYLLWGYFETLPRDFEEAAYIDGAGYFKTMVRIMFPLAKPSIITVILFNFLSFWNEYILALTLLGEESRTLPVGLMNLMQGQQAKAEYGTMYAGLVLIMLPTIILYICVNRHLTEGMTAGGVKG
jgi:N-acetylglucosamine transport system permease protein